MREKVAPKDRDLRRKHLRLGHQMSGFRGGLHLRSNRLHFCYQRRKIHGIRPMLEESGDMDDESNEVGVTVESEEFREDIHRAEDPGTRVYALVEPPEVVEDAGTRRKLTRQLDAFVNRDLSDQSVAPPLPP